MKKIAILALAGMLLLGAVPWAMADEDGESFVESKAVVGYHYLDGEDFLARLGEYVDLEEAEDLRPDMELEMYGGTDSALFRIMALYENQYTNGFGMQIEGGKNWRAKTEYKSFYHNLDRDNMENLAAREIGPTIVDPTADDPQDKFAPGGKQVFHSDLDPEGVYGIQYQRVDAEIEWDVPWLAHTTVYSRFNDQKRQGYKQQLSLAHCAVCHVESNGRKVDDQILTWTTGLETKIDKFALNYDYTATHWTDHSSGLQRTYINAMHPTRGMEFGTPGQPGYANYDVEFGSRVSFDGVTAPAFAPRSTTKQTHNVGARFELPAASVLRAGYNRTDKTNGTTDLKGTFDSYVLSFMNRPTQTTRVTGRVLYYETRVDDYDVDLDPWRAGRPGGDLDMDWTRISAANRDVLQADLNAGWRWRPGGFLKGSYRYKMTDRESMTQTQVTYIPIDTDGDGVNDTNQMIEATPYNNETIENRVQLLASQRFGRKGSVRLRATINTFDEPFGNPTGICEDGREGEDVADLLLVGSPNFYYFQRERYGNATERPTFSQRYSLQSSYQLTPRASLGGYATLGFEENDELNSGYTFERNLVSLGAHAWAAPKDQLLFTVGYAFNSVESNANLCPPLFDG